MAWGVSLLLIFAVSFLFFFAVDALLDTRVYENRPDPGKLLDAAKQDGDNETEYAALRDLCGKAEALIKKLPKNSEAVDAALAAGGIGFFGLLAACIADGTPTAQRGLVGCLVSLAAMILAALAAPRFQRGAPVRYNAVPFPDASIQQDCLARGARLKLFGETDAPAEKDAGALSLYHIEYFVSSVSGLLRPLRWKYILKILLAAAVIIGLCLCGNFIVRGGVL